MQFEAGAKLKVFALPRESEESDLLSRRQTGNAEAFALLLQRYRNRIFNLAWQLLGDRDEAEDVAQETFLQAFEHLHEFRGESQISTWLYRIAVNAC
ncbi:MAG: sigma-70 family RNA polymerase sigma factor, partial [Armatimonadetes bacterium]|nr:sigma-70 family RNA polymerase sigma factor [Armatimonadota bacterium]